MPSQEEIKNLADGSSMPGAREKASSEELFLNTIAVVDLSLETCCGQKNSFHEAKHAYAKFRQNWAKVCVR